MRPLRTALSIRFGVVGCGDGDDTRGDHRTLQARAWRGAALCRARASHQVLPGTVLGCRRSLMLIGDSFSYKDVQV